MFELFGARNRLPYFFPNDRGFSMHLLFRRILEQNVVTRLLTNNSKWLFSLFSNSVVVDIIYQTIIKVRKLSVCLGYNAKSCVVFLNSIIVKWFLLKNTYTLCKVHEISLAWLVLTYVLKERCEHISLSKQKTRHGYINSCSRYLRMALKWYLWFQWNCKQPQVDAWNSMSNF